MNVAVIPITPFQQNCSHLVCEQTNKAAVVDPGSDFALILDAVKEQGALAGRLGGGPPCTLARSN